MRSLSRTISMMMPSLTVVAALLLQPHDATADPVSIASTNYRIALVPKRVTSPFFAVSHNGCLDAARRLGVTCSYVGPEISDADEQARIILGLIESRQIDGLAVSVIDIPTITPVIKQAVENGIPVVTFDSDAPESPRSAYIGTNNTFFGVQLAKVLKQLIPEPIGGTYAVLSARAPNVQEREKGLRASLKAEDWTEIVISPSFMEDNDTLAMLQIEEFGKFNPTAIVPLVGAPMRAEGWKAFVNNHPNTTMVVADGMPNQLELLGENYASGLVGQKPYEMGYRAVEVLFDLLEGRTLNQDFIGTNLLEHTNIPLVLPELVIDMNRVGDLRYVGFILFGLVLSIAVGFAVWMWIHRDVRVVKVAQPKFLMIIAVGVVHMAAAMVPLGFDDSKDDYNGTAICMSTPWLGVVGFALAFSGLFAKTARVKKIFQAQNVGSKPTEAQVLRPFLLLLTADVAILTAWTIVDPLSYARIDHEGTDGWNRIVSTYGTCQSENVVPYIVPLAVMNIGVLIIGNWQAYETRMIKSEFSESKFIGLSMASMLQATLTGIPLLFIVRENPQAYYLILVFMTFVISTVILVLMFVPKIVYAMGTKDMDLSEQDQLIQRRIHSSIEAVQQKSSALSSRNCAQENDTLHEPDQNEVLPFPESAEEPVMEADCSFIQRSQVAGYNGQLEKGQLSLNEDTTARTVVVSKPVLLKESAISSLQAGTTENQSGSAASAVVPGAVAMGSSEIAPHVYGNSVFKNRKDVTICTGVDSCPGAFAVQPSRPGCTKSANGDAMVKQRYNAAMLALSPDDMVDAADTSEGAAAFETEHDDDLLLKQRYRAAMLATAPDGDGEPWTSPDIPERQSGTAPGDIAAGPACDGNAV